MQIGSALGSTIGQWLRVDPQRLRTLVGCGAAAGIAATFNAPIAGALFAVEIILGDFGVAQFSPIVISSVVGTVVSQHFLGDFPAFEVPSYTLVHASELFAYAGLGLLAGLVAVGFVRTLYATEDLVDHIPVYPPLKTMVDGALIGIAAVVLDGAEIGEEALVAAGAVVPPGTRVPAGMLVRGVPARSVRSLSGEERRAQRAQTLHYVETARAHAAEDFST